jgi:hypothetical protein
VAALQDRWDRETWWPRQRAELAQLVAQAPGFAPNTMIVLLDASRSWIVNFGFRHALHFLYGEQVMGTVWGAMPAGYPVRLDAEGAHSEPAESIRKPWRSPATTHRHDEIVAVRIDADRKVAILDTWPAELPALPPGARYEPRARILAVPRPEAARILERER